MSLSRSPRVSVIIPVFNGAGYVCGAIDSALRQTYAEIEVIVVDDGSTDDTRGRVTPYVQAGKIKYVHQENRGLAAARNAGIRIASGEFLKFLDCDDFLFERQIELQVDHLRGRDKVISLTDHMFYYEDGKTRTVKIELGTGSQLARMIIGNFMPVHNILVGAAMVIQAGGFDEKLTALEDADLWLRLLWKGARIEKVDYVGCGYRIVSNSLSSNIDRMFFMRCRVSEKLNAAMLADMGRIDGKVEEALLINNTRLIEGCCARGVRMEEFLPKTVECTRQLFLSRKAGLRGFLVRSIGCQAYLRLKYRFQCLRSRGYKGSLLSDEIKWRNHVN